MRRRMVASTATAPSGLDQHRVELDQLKRLFDQHLAHPLGEPRRSAEVYRHTAAPAGQQRRARAATRSARSIRAALAGNGRTATSPSTSVQMPPSPITSAGTTRVRAGGDDQLDTGRGHPLGEHGPQAAS